MYIENINYCKCISYLILVFHKKIDGQIDYYDAPNNIIKNIYNQNYIVFKSLKFPKS
jgi:hypothetical protein